MNTLKYWQLLDEHYNPLAEGDENPANIPDNTGEQEAAKLATAWMKAHDISEAVLVQNEADEEGSDNIVAAWHIYRDDK